MQDRRDAEGWEGEGEEEEVFGVAPLHVCVFVPEQWGEVSAVTKKNSSPPSFRLLLTLYSCGNVIVLVIVHFIDNWFMMILVAVYVYLKINAMKSPWS